MTDAEVLRAAAARIREVGFDPASAMAEADLDVMEGDIDRLFIVGPAIATPLAEWLEQTAVQVAGSAEAGFDCRMDGSRYLPALKVADAVMGERR